MAVSKEERGGLLLQLAAVRQQLRMKQKLLAADLQDGDRLLHTSGQMFAANDIARSVVRQSLALKRVPDGEDEEEEEE